MRALTLSRQAAWHMGTVAAHTPYTCGNQIISGHEFGWLQDFSNSLRDTQLTMQKIWHEYNIALTRELASSFKDALTMHPPPEPIDVEQAEQEHAAYVELLRTLVPKVLEVPADHTCPDCCFIEDTAVVIGSGIKVNTAVAVLTRPGAVSRRPEVAGVQTALEQLGFAAQPDASHPHKLHRLSEPATCDGGDVLFVGTSLWVGISARTNAAAVEQMRACLDGVCPVFGIPMPDGGALHLKSLVTAIAEDTLLLADTRQGRALMDVITSLDGALQGHHCLWVPDMLCANVLRIGKHVVFQGKRDASSEQIVREFCESRGLQLHCISMREFAKADGALTCCSLLFSL